MHCTLPLHPPYSGNRVGWMQTIARLHHAGLMHSVKTPCTRQKLSDASTPREVASHLQSSSSHGLASETYESYTHTFVVSNLNLQTRLKLDELIAQGRLAIATTGAVPGSDRTQWTSRM